MRKFCIFTNRRGKNNGERRVFQYNSDPPGIQFVSHRVHASTESSEHSTFLKISLKQQPKETGMVKHNAQVSPYVTLGQCKISIKAQGLKL